MNISIASVFDGGSFECRARNDIGSVSHSALVRVNGPTQIRRMQNESVIAMQSISLPCRIVGYEPDLIGWQKDGRGLPFNHRQRVHANGTLEIHNLDRDADSGIYTCTATSSAKSGESVSQSVAITVKGTYLMAAVN